MTSYAPVVVTGSAVEGRQQQQSPEGDRVNGAFGTRRAWWWQAGPVDSYHFCFPLSTGVALLSMYGLIVGIWVLLYAFLFYDADAEHVIITSLAMSQKEYARSCEGPAFPTADCERLKASMEQAKGRLNVLLHYPTALYVQAILDIVGGVFGIWGVCFKHTRAAKVYMLTRAAAILVAVWWALEMRLWCAKYDVDQRYNIIDFLITSFFLLYYFKVAWSYYQRRLEYSYDAPPTSRDNASDTINDATPMPAMNTTV